MNFVEIRNERMNKWCGYGALRYPYYLRTFCDRITPDTPFSNFVLKITLALLNIPSFSETMMNCVQDKQK